MKKITLILALTCIFIIGVSQTTIWTEDFETDGQGVRYTASTPFNDGTSDHWNRTNGSDISNVTSAYTTADGTYFWAAEDTDDDGGNGQDEQTIVFNTIDISDATNLVLYGLFGAGNENGTGSSAYDAADHIHVKYSIDGGAENNAIWFSYENNGDIFNEPIGLDADFDGQADENGTNRLGTNLVEYSFLIPGTGSNLNITIYVYADGASEELAFDYFRVQGDVGGGPTPLDANFYADNTSILVGETVNFTDITSGGTSPYSWSWDFDGGGEDATTQNPSFVYPTAGIYTVSLTVTDDASGTDTETKTDYITVVEVATGMIINEVDADQTGTDANEFIELYDGGAGNTVLTGLVVVLYAGDDTDASYAAYDLDSYSTDANGYFVIGSATVPNVDLIAFTTNGIQNGEDAVALFIGDDTDFPNGTAVTTTNLVDALVYGTNDPDDPELLVLLNPGEPQINEGGRGSSVLHSNQRIPNGTGGLRNTYTYDQSPPTPGEENLGLYTDWTGADNDVWNNDENWSNVRPDADLNALIPGTATIFPKIYVEGAESYDLTIESGASLDIYGSLTVEGTFTNDGTLNILSDEFGTGSLIEHDGVSANVDRYFTGDPTGTQDWHLVSPPISNALAGVFTGMYLQSFDHTTYEYTGITNELSSLNVAEGYGLYSTLSVDNTVTFSGALNHSIPPVSIYTGADSYNWNLLGNPYPSSIDWDAVPIPANMSNEVHYIRASDGGDASYVQGIGGINGGARYIPPMQGFFVSVTGDDLLDLNDGVRTHDGKDNFFKSYNPLLLLLEASNENFTDETMIHFNENAGVEHDGQFDAYKRISNSNPELPQIFSYTPQGVKLGINGMPQTEMVPVGFQAGIDGEYVIQTVEINDIQEVWLEDTFTGIFTDLTSDSYAFNFTTGDDPNRFVLHFTPMSVDDILVNGANIYSYDKDVYVTVSEFTDGNISIFNTMGQEVATCSDKQCSK